MSASVSRKKNVVFVCTHNEVRSLTAEQLYRGRSNLEVRSAGIASHAKNQLTQQVVDWADMIVVFEAKHLALLKRQFPDIARKVELVLIRLQDVYDYKSPKLIFKLASKLRPYLGKPVETGAIASGGDMPMVGRFVQNYLFEKAV